MITVQIFFKKNVMNYLPKIVKNIWFKDTDSSDVYINEVAVRIRAGIFLIIPLYMGLMLYDVAYTSKWMVDNNTAIDTYGTNWDDQIIYAVEAVKRTYEYSTQTFILFYVLFEMIAGMFVTTSRLSPSILISSFFARNQKPAWVAIAPKRFAWSIGASIVITCIIFFNPVVFAHGVNDVFNAEILPTTERYMPAGMGIALVSVCLLFMWMEAILGYCVGCKIHGLLVKMGILKKECHACNNLSWNKK